MYLLTGIVIHRAIHAFLATSFNSTLFSPLFPMHHSVVMGLDFINRYRRAQYELAGCLIFHRESNPCLIGAALCLKSG